MNLAPGLLFRFPHPGSSGNSFNMADVSEEVTFLVRIILNFYVLDQETKQNPSMSPDDKELTRKWAIDHEKCVRQCTNRVKKLDGKTEN